MNKHFLILLATTVVTAFSQCIEPGELCETDEECCSGECYIIAGVGGLCTIPTTMEVRTKTNSHASKFNQIEDHLNSKCSDRAMPCNSDEECCSDLVCKEGFGPGPECLLNNDNCLEPLNECYANEECCYGVCLQIAVGGGICSGIILNKSKEG